MGPHPPWHAAHGVHRYTGHTLAKFIVTFVIGVVTGCFAVALGKCVAFLVESKLDFIQAQMDKQMPPPEVLILEDGSVEVGESSGNKSLAVLYAGLWYWLFGSVLAALATSMVSGSDGTTPCSPNRPAASGLAYNTIVETQPVSSR